VKRTIRTFSTVSRDLLALSDWLSGQGITHVAMESSGEYWKPVYNLLESSFTVWVVNAQHVKTVPGRKTDVKDAEWLADLLRHGLLRGSFIPLLPQRDLRDLTRSRTNLVRERATVSNRLQKVLEWANLKLAAVISDINGVSGRRILDAIAAGTEDAQHLADLAHPNLRADRAALSHALTGQVREHHRFLIASHLSHLRFLEAQIQHFDERIAQHLHEQPDWQAPAGETPEAGAEPQPCSGAGPSSLSWDKAVELLDSIPGVARRMAQLVLGEIGLDMTRFPSAAHLAKWAKLCPGNYESAGKRLSGSIGHGNPWLRSALVQAAHAAVRCRGTYLAEVYRRLSARRGKLKAIVAVAHRLLIAAYHILRKQEPYQDVRAN
jgi:transposase